MWKILVPVDGSDGSARAVQHVIKLRTLVAPLDVHLLYVQVPPAPTGEDTPHPAVPAVVGRQAMSPAKRCSMLRRFPMRAPWRRASSARRSRRTRLSTAATLSSWERAAWVPLGNCLARSPGR